MYGIHSKWGRLLGGVVSLHKLCQKRFKIFVQKGPRYRSKLDPILLAATGAELILLPVNSAPVTKQIPHSLYALANSST